MPDSLEKFPGWVGVEIEKESRYGLLLLILLLGTITCFCLLICNALQGSLPWKKRKKVCQTWRGPKKGSLTTTPVHPLSDCAALHEIVYKSTPECAFIFSSFSHWIYTPPPKCCTCVCTLSRNDGYLRVLAAMSETCRATWPLHLFFSDFSSSPLFPAKTRKAKKKKKKVIEHVHTAYCIYIVYIYVPVVPLYTIN